jgi:FkbM family methyltransferase
VLTHIGALPRLACTYTAEVYSALKRRLRLHPGDILRSFPAWVWSVSFSRGPLADRRPWITFAAARFLLRQLSPQTRVFEYGAGGSTLFFAKRVGELVSVEHDAAWLERTRREMQAFRPRARWEAHLAEPVLADGQGAFPEGHPYAYASSDPSFAGKSFREYASAIDRYPDNYFDIVLIDGRARPSCFQHALRKVKVGGYIVLDNAERHEYAYVEEVAGKLGLVKTQFWGPGPYNQYFWRTLFLRKVRRGFALNELDVQLERFLDFDNGVFVEAGANDGISQSNTYYFELYRGWTGLLVEPIPVLAQLCRRYRSRANVEQVALIGPQDPARAVTLRYANLMSVVKGGMKSRAEEDAHVQAGMRLQKVETYEIDVAATTLSALLDKHGLQRIDLLSLDVEGYELNALKGLDLSRHRPRYILVEARYRAEVHAYLAGKYELVAELSHHDLLYRSREEEAPTASQQR